jgi:serine/threonine protein kinase
MQPEKIGRYEIKSELGRGGMATVYHGYDPRFEREVAVKVLPPELLHADPQFKLRFEREAKIIAQLEHSSIVPVYDVGDEGGQPYFVMRYMNGGSLSERIKARIMTVEEATKILAQIAPGMDEAHSKGIVHRDLKPSNILFDGKGTPYISDFGIAKLTQAQAGNVTGSAIIGTPAYMAPEQASGETVDGRSDIYALGIILYEMLTGRQPYEADTPMAVAIKHITDPVPHILEANPNLPNAIEAVIQAAMAKSKNERFATAGDLVEALRDVSSGKAQLETLKGVPPRTIKVGPKPAKVAKKPFNVWLVIVPLILVGMIGGGVALFNMIKPPLGTEVPTNLPVIVPATATSEPVTQPSETPVIPAATDTEAPPPATDTPLPPKSLAIGGADKIAFVANREIWLMNVDGSEPRQLTTDGASKNDLQWLPDGNTILFLSGKVVKYYNVATDTVDTLASFPSEVTVDAFQVSHDGTQVMIAMSNEIFVVPFDFETMKTITNRNQLLRMENVCILPTGGTRAALKVKEARWSIDDKLVAWLFKGVAAGNASLQSEQVSVLNIQSCDPTKIDQLDNFPGTRFDPVGFQSRIMPDFDWNGTSQFTFNTSRRNNGWGELYIYNWETHKPTLLYPIDNKCCYRDARWSPDGTFLIFAFQDLQPDAPTFLYYVPAGELEVGANFTPIPLPEGFFKDPREAPQPALRPAQP